MKNQLLVSTILLMSFIVHAQFIDDMESYTEGQPISGGHWTDASCGGGPGCAIMSSSIEAHSGSLSGLIPNDGTTDAVLDLGNKIFDLWLIDFWMYVPSDNEAFFQIESSVPSGGGEPFGYTYFNQGLANPGIGFIENVQNGPIYFNFPHDEWFRIYMDVDITFGIAQSTWQLTIDDVEVIQCETPFTDGGGQIPTSLGGINFFSISVNNTYYLDDFLFVNSEFSCDLGIEDYWDSNLSLYPNPVKDLLAIDNSSSIEITSIKIYDVLGRLILTEIGDVKQIDVSHLDSGVLFVEIMTEIGVVSKKIIKE